MKSPYKRCIVYDLETGGLNEEFNSITEIAMVAVDFETLKIVDEFSVMLLPRLDLSYRTKDIVKDAKMLYKNLAVKDDALGIKTIKYKGQDITTKNLNLLHDDIIKFYSELDKIYPDNILLLKDIEEYEKSDLKDIFQLYFNNSYNPQALEATKISRKMLEEEGISYEQAFSKTKEFISLHTIGNSKPILSGHNIGSKGRRLVKGKEKKPTGFDNPFMEIFFKKNNDDFFDCINDLILDTLELVRLRWMEMPNFSLGTCANELGLTLKEAHRALPDTIANANLFIKLFKSFRGEGGQKSNYVRPKYTFNF